MEATSYGIKKKTLIIVGIVLLVGIISGFVFIKNEDVKFFGEKPLELEGITSQAGELDYLDHDYMELLIKTSDSSPSKLDKKDWTQELFDEERYGNTHQGYVILANPSGWKWGNLELDPKRFMILKIPTSEFNESWLEPEYYVDSKTGKENETIKTARKYRFPLDELLTTEEFDDLKTIEYNSDVSWTIEKDSTSLSSDVKDIVEYNNWSERPEEIKLHGSSGYFTMCEAGAPTCNYSSWESFNSGEAADLTGTGPAILNITGTWSARESSATVFIQGFTTTAVDYIHIFTDKNTGARHDGTWTTTAYRVESADRANPARGNEDFMWIEGVQIWCQRTAGSACWEDAGGNTFVSNKTYSYNLLRGNGSSNILGFDVTTDSNWTVYNNIIYDVGTGVLSYNYCDGCDFWKVESNTIYNCTDYGIRTYTSGNMLASNNLVHDCTDDYSGTFKAGSTNNSYSQGAVAGSNGFNATDYAASDLFVDATTEEKDLHLKAGSPVIDKGSTLSYSDLDIDSETRPDGSYWDIGADEYVSAEPEADSCGCPTAADWKVDCSDNCNNLSICNIPDNNLILSGSGTFTVGADIIVNAIHKDKQCTVYNDYDDGNELMVRKG